MIARTDKYRTTSMTKRFYHLALSVLFCLLTCTGCETGTDAQEAAQYRKNFRAKLESCKQLTLPYKLRMDTHALDEDPSYHAEFDYAWHELLAYILNHTSDSTKNSFPACNYIVGYLPDTSKYFTLLAMDLETDETLGYILTFDKNFEPISSQCMHNHYSLELVEDVLTDENYFTIDNDLKIHYYFHKRTYYEDDAIPIERYGEEEYENHGYIDSNGVIVYDTINEVTLKCEINRL